MTIAPGDRLDDYEILALAGQGSMGEVYRAKDTKLGRNVAIKVLPEHLASDSERLRRFEQEARTASALNHPHIVTIYEIGEHEGAPYIAMEYVEGVTLFDTLAAGPLEEGKLIRYLAQMAEGLAKAHQAGIVHRDLKPENVIITEDDYVKILDFGLAKLVPREQPHPEASTVVRDTLPGMVVGTPGYLSPEQAKGQTADFRSDQFSLGVIAYEMATGTRPFERPSPAQTLAAIIEHEPEPITLLNPRVPGRLASVINRCLAKDAEQRYRSTSEIAKAVHAMELAPPPESASRRPVAIVVAALTSVTTLVVVFGLLTSDVRERVGGDVVVARIESVAVLPLENLSGDPEQEYFADGMTEALIGDLAKISALRVISRRSVMRYKDSNEPLPDIARALDVDAIVAGTVLRVDDEVRITTQLIRGSTDEHIWAESYDRDLEDVLSLLSELAQVIAKEIEVAITPEQRELLAAGARVDAAVQETYLRARFFLNRLGEDDIEQARALFQQTIDLDPTFAPGYSGLALAEFLAGTLTSSSDEDTPTRAIAAATQALEIDPSLAEAYSALGLVQLYHEWDWDEAERTLNRAIALNPNDSMARHGMADYLLTKGEFEESVRQIELARRADPMSPLTIASVIGHLIFAKRYDGAIEEAEEMLELFPGPGVYGFLALARWQRGANEEALAAYRMAWGEQSPVYAAMTRAYDEGGPEAAMLAVAELLADAAEAGGSSPTVVAAHYAAAGEADSAFEWLDRALVERAPQLLHITGDPRFDPIRDDPRFRTVLERMNFPS